MSDLERHPSGLIARVLALPGALRRELLDVAEMFSDAGHGPNAWREKGDLPSPYAGWGPPDDEDDAETGPSEEEPRDDRTPMP